MKEKLENIQVNVSVSGEKMNNLIKFLAPTELWPAPALDENQLDMFSSYLVGSGDVGCVVDEDYGDYITLIGNKIFLVPKLSQDILYEIMLCD